MPGIECGEPGPCRRIRCLILWRNGESSKQQIASQKQTLNYKRGGLSRALIAKAAVKMFEELRAPSTQPLWRKFFYSNFSLSSSCTAAPGSGQGRAGQGQVDLVLASAGEEASPALQTGVQWQGCPKPRNCSAGEHGANMPLPGQFSHIGGSTGGVEHAAPRAKGSQLCHPRLSAWRRAAGAQQRRSLGSAGSCRSNCCVLGR